jgi:hypothetical protein
VARDLVEQRKMTTTLGKRGSARTLTQSKDTSRTWPTRTANPVSSRTSRQSVRRRVPSFSTPPPGRSHNPGHRPKSSRRCNRRRRSFRKSAPFTPVSTRANRPRIDGSIVWYEAVGRSLAQGPIRTQRILREGRALQLLEGRSVLNCGARIPPFGQPPTGPGGVRPSKRGGRLRTRPPEAHPAPALSPSAWGQGSARLDGLALAGRATPDEDRTRSLRGRAGQFVLPRDRLEEISEFALPEGPRVESGV